MKIWFDTEFIEDGKTIDLMSIGVIREDGEQYYAEAKECDLFKASPWVMENVVPHLNGFAVPRKRIADDLILFMGEKPEIWAYYADYDWVALCQLFGTMMDLPKGWPMYCCDVKQLCDSLGNPTLPKQTSQEHNALADAIWTKQAWEFLTVVAPPPQVDSGREWQPIGTAPRDGTWLLLFNELGNHHIGRFGVRYLGDPGPEAWCCEGKYIAGPTHWMPLPLRPVRSGGREA